MHTAHTRLVMGGRDLDGDALNKHVFRVT